MVGVYSVVWRIRSSLLRAFSLSIIINSSNEGFCVYHVLINVIFYFF